MNLLSFEGLGNNVRKGGGLRVEDGGLTHLGGKEQLSDCRFEADIIAI